MDTPSRFTCNEGSANEEEGCGASESSIDSHVAFVSASSAVPTEQLQSEDSNTAPAIVSLSVSAEIQEAFLKDLYDTLSGRYLELSFSMARSTTEDSRCTPYLLITQRNLHYHPPYGMISRVQLSVQFKTYSVHVMMRLWREEVFESVDDLADICEMIGNNSKHKFCPGIEMEHYISEYHKIIRYHIKSVRFTKFPFHHVDSQKCKLLFEVSHNATATEKASSELRCYPCKRLVTDLEHQKRKTSAETPTRKIKRQRPSSRAKLSYMSPASQARRKRLAQYERTNRIRKLNSFEDSEVMLNDDQNDEMCSIVQSIGNDELEQLCLEGEKHGVGKIMKDIWLTDAQQRKQEFFEDQAKTSMLLL